MISSIYLLTFLFLLAVWAWVRVFRVPKSIAHLPEVSMCRFLLSYLRGESVDLRFDRLFRPKLAEYGYARTWTQGRWEIIISDATIAKEVLLRNNDFLKRNPDDDQSMLLLVRRMFGLINITVSDGQEWRRRRRIVNPSFKRTYYPSMFEKPLLGMIRMIDECKGKPIYMLDMMRRVTLDAYGQIMLGHDFQALSLGEDHYSAKSYGQLLFAVGNPLFFALPELENILPHRKKSHRQGQAYREFLRGIIRTRASCSDLEGDDVLTLLVKDMIGDGYDPLSEDEVIDDMVAILVAGHDTIANAMTSIIYFLAKFPPIQKRLRAEIFFVMGKKNLDIPTNHQLKEMPFLECVIKEGLRIVTTVSQLRRYCHTEQTLSCGLTIPARTSIQIESWGVHHNESAFRNPHLFDPDRFLHLEKEPNNWFPFGYGTRMCAGKNFAMIEQRSILVLLLQRYSFQLDDKSKDELQPRFNPSSLIHPLDVNIIFNHLPQ